MSRLFLVLALNAAWERRASWLVAIAVQRWFGSFRLERALGHKDFS
jgi:hypothetical protein